MGLLVQKFGGSSLATAARINQVAHRILQTIRSGHQVVAVVSAMGSTTDQLLELANQISHRPLSKDLDLLLSTGEDVSVAALVLAINSAMPCSAMAFSARSAGVHTDANFGIASILSINSNQIFRALKKGLIPIIPGFQGFNQATDAITTLGRGGSDLSAIALAIALRAEICEIYSDVDGVFTTDPRICRLAQRFDAIRSDSLLELSASGAQIMAPRAVEYARRFRMPIHVRSSFSELNGTVINNDGKINYETIPNWNFEDNMSGFEMTEGPLLYGIAIDTDSAKIDLLEVADRPGICSKLFQLLADANIRVDLITQNAVSSLTNISFIVPKLRVLDAVAILNQAQADLGFSTLASNAEIAKVSLVGASIKTNPQVLVDFFDVLAELEVNAEMISTSEIRITVVIAAAALELTVRRLHTKFGLDAKTDHAIVYGESLSA
jgi:aspartate kinase